MGRYRFFSAGRVACFLGFCAGALSACLNPIPDDFPNQDDRHFDQPDPENEGSGGGASGPVVTNPDSPAEPPLGSVDGEAPPASNPPEVPDAGAGDAGSAGGTVGGR